MKRNVFIGAMIWAALISVLHIHLNVGWGEFQKEVSSTITGEERQELIVGFLPVT